MPKGPRTVVGTVRITGNAALTEAELRPLIKLAEGQPFYAPQVNADRDALIVDYLNNGFSTADVVVTPVFSTDRTRADLTYTVQEGPQTIVDHILIVGNSHTDPRVILREMKLKPGAPLGREDRDESQRALSALGLFRRVRITELRHGSGPRQDVLVTVDEAPMTTISYGGGLEANQQLRATGPGGEAQRAARVRAARLLQHRPAQRRRPQPHGRPLHPRQPSAAGRPRRSGPRTAPASASSSTASSARCGSRGPSFRATWS